MDLIEYRQKHNLSLYQLSDIVKMSVSALCKIENGLYSSNEITLQNKAKYLSQLLNEEITISNLTKSKNYQSLVNENEYLRGQLKNMKKTFVILENNLEYYKKAMNDLEKSLESIKSLFANIKELSKVKIVHNTRKYNRKKLEIEIK